MRVAFLLLALAAAGFIRPATAQRSLAIERFHANIAVNRDGDVDVTEAITARFTGKWNGIYRTIPVEYRTPQGFNWTIQLDLQSATDSAGAALRTESRRDRHYMKYKMWVPGAEDATRTVLLRYRAENGLRFFEDHDELYWNVTGDEWDVPIEAASATVELPPGATNVRAIAFNGVYGSTAQDAVVKLDGSTVTVRMPHPLRFHEGLTVVVGWDKGLVRAPTAVERTEGFLAANWPLLIPVPFFFGMFGLWYRRGRDPRTRSIQAQYEPPDGLTPAEAGTLLDEKADMRDITATLVDLAVRGYIRIEEHDEAGLFGLFKTRDYMFHRLKPRSEWGTLALHEQLLLAGLFADGTTPVLLSDLENEFYQHVGGIKRAVSGRLVERKLYGADPESVRGRWRAGAIVVVVGIMVLGIGAGARMGLTPVPFFLAAVLSGLIVAGFGHLMPARTASGTRALEGVLGFSEFLERVEKDRYERVIRTPEMFERFLPFAMAFGVEKKWARAFRDIYLTPPRWYTGADGTSFNAPAFSSRLGALSSRASSTMTSAPRSSSGSGFGGGGSSGGGGGGGGGGGF